MMQCASQSYFRAVRHGTTLPFFGMNNPYKRDEDCQEMTWTGLLVSLFECDIICRDFETKTLRLALVMWLKTTPSEACVHSPHESHDVTGTGNDGWYDIIEIDRLLGPEYIVPCMRMSDEECHVYVDSRCERRDFRKRPITDKEKWTRVSMARRIGSAHTSTLQTNIFRNVMTGL